SFGCLCFPFLRPYTNNKLEFWSQPCIFIGYNSKHKGYICFHVPTSRVYISRHVIFDEAVSAYPSHSCPKVSPDSHPSGSIPLSILQQAATSPISSSPVVQSAPSLSDLSLSSSESSPLSPAVPVSTAPIESIDSLILTYLSRILVSCIFSWELRSSILHRLFSCLSRSIFVIFLSAVACPGPNQSALQQSRAPG
ncbi:hypothetical protein V2J09_008574, partial [Rumex salicifolius]